MAKAKRKCQAKAKTGKACKVAPLKDGDFCISHLPRKERDARGFGGPQPGSGRPPNPRAVDVLRERVEAEIDKWLQPLVEGRDATRHFVVGNGHHAHLEEAPDIPTRMAASREAMDRVYGRSKQATEITGADGGPLKLTFAELASAADGDGN